MRGPDPGHPRVRRSTTRSTPPSPPPGVPPGRRPRHPHARRPRQPRLHSPDQPIGRYLPGIRRALSSTARTGRTAATRAGGGSSPRRAVEVVDVEPCGPARRPHRRRRRRAASRSFAVPTAGCAGSRRSSTRTSPPPCSPGPSPPTCSSSRPTSTTRRSTSARRGAPRAGHPAELRRPPRPGSSPPGGWVRRSTPRRFVEGGGPGRHHLPRPHHRRRRGDLGTVSSPRSPDPPPPEPPDPPKGTHRARRHRGPQGRTKTVSDASGLAELVDAGVIDADRVVAVIGKTEGNGGVNDYTRIIADRAFREVLVARAPTPRRSSRCRSCGPGHGRCHLAARDDLRQRCRPRPPADRRAAAHGRLRDERAAAPRGDRHVPMVTRSRPR